MCAVEQPGQAGPGSHQTRFAMRLAMFGVAASYECGQLYGGVEIGRIGAVAPNHRSRSCEFCVAITCIGAIKFSVVYGQLD